jgi:hypothetical protein
MVASSNQQETDMGTQKVETDALSDDQLAAVSGGDKVTESEQAKINAEEKKQADALKGFQQALQELP